MLELDINEAQQTELPPELSRALLQLLTSARDSMSQNPRGADHYIEQATQLLRGAESRTVPEYQTGGLAPWQVRVVREHIAANLAEPLPTQDLAARVRLSASHFARAFKATLGVSPHAYVIRQRVERAKELMLTTDTPLSEIALICGLADQSHLTRVFGRHEGHSPGAWRRMNPKKEHSPPSGRTP
jgi:AraC family transcriptional regulator